MNYNWIIQSYNNCIIKKPQALPGKTVPYFISIIHLINYVFPHCDVFIALLSNITAELLDANACLEWN